MRLLHNYSSLGLKVRRRVSFLRTDNYAIVNVNAKHFRCFQNLATLSLQKQVDIYVKEKPVPKA